MAAETFMAIATLLGPAIGEGVGAAATGGGEAYPPNWSGRRWAEEMGRAYPDFPGMPEQVGQMGTALSQMLGGELAPAVQQYLTGKYQQAWGQALPGLADIGAGPGTLASLQLQAGERQAVEGAYLGQQQIAKGMEFMPQYTEMMLSPYMADVGKWGDIAGAWQGIPGGPGRQPGQKIPGFSY